MKVFSLHLIFVLLAVHSITVKVAFQSIYTCAFYNSSSPRWAPKEVYWRSTSTCVHYLAAGCESTFPTDAQ